MNSNQICKKKKTNINLKSTVFERQYKIADRLIHESATEDAERLNPSWAYS